MRSTAPAESRQHPSATAHVELAALCLSSPAPQNPRPRPRRAGKVLPRDKAPRFPGGPAADPAGSHHERRIRSFQPRRSRVTTGQGEYLERLWPVWGFDIDGHARRSTWPSCSTGFPSSWRSASAWARPPRRWPRTTRHRHPRRGRAHPRPGQPPRPRRARRPDQHPRGQRRRDHPAARDAGAGRPGRAARVLPGPLAQEAPPQAPPDPARVPLARRDADEARRRTALRDGLGDVRRADAGRAERAPRLREHRGGRRLRAAARVPAADPVRGPGSRQGARGARPAVPPGTGTAR